MKWKNIVSNANKIKKQIETNKQLPTIKGYSYADLIYIFSKAVKTPNKDITDKKVSKAPSPSGNNISKNLTKAEYQKIAQNNIEWINDRGTCANYSIYQNYHIRPRLLLYCLSKIIVYYDENNNTLPLTCLFRTSDVENTKSSSPNSGKSSSSSTSNCTNPYKALPYNSNTGCNAMGQDTGYFCACSMVQKMMYRLGYKISQEELARVMGTTEAGTGHYGIETGVAYCGRKFGVKFNVHWYDFSDLGWKKMGEFMCKKNTAVGNHVLYRDQWGHYEYPLTVNTSNGTMKVINSLGSSCGSCYCGYIEERSQSTHRRYINGISQKSVLVIEKV